MDGIANVARQQQTQVAAAENHARAQSQVHEVQQASSAPKIEQEKNVNEISKIDSKEKVEDLVKKLNDALSPISTDIKFGVDRQDVFYVAVIDEKHDRMLRRFPAEQAQELLPKMQEVGGILFDSKG